MLNKKYRPRTFKEIEGQEIPKKVLSKVAESPEGKHQVYILQGAFGCSKTTSARVFGKAINCLSRDKPCMRCSSCKSPVLRDDRYQEYDSAMVGSVKDIRELRESWGFLSAKENRVFVFDEFQRVSKEGQAALLEPTENPPKKVFFLFCTTEMEKIIKPLVSRSVILEFNTLSPEGIGNVIDRIVRAEGIDISEKMKKMIIRRASGHVRDAVGFLDIYAVIGEDLKGILSLADELFVRFFRYACEGNEEEVKKVLKELARFPVLTLKEDFSRIVRTLLQRILVEEKDVVKGLGEKQIVRVLNVYCQFSNILEGSTNDFISFMFYIYSILKGEKLSVKKDLMGERYKRK